MKALLPTVKQLVIIGNIFSVTFISIGRVEILDEQGKG
jgi:hypothetical protein